MVTILLRKGSGRTETIMGKGMQCMANGPAYPVAGKGDAAVLGRPGQAAESFGGGPLISDVR